MGRKYNINRTDVNKHNYCISSFLVLLKKIYLYIKILESEPELTKVNKFRQFFFAFSFSSPVFFKCLFVINIKNP